MDKQNDLSADLYKQLPTLAKGAGIDFIGTIAGRVLAFFFSLILVWVLQPDIIGIFFLAWTTLSLVMIFPTFGFETALLRFIGKYDGVGDNEKVIGFIQASFIISLFLSIVSTFFIYFFSDWISVLANKPELAYAIRFLSFALPFLVISTVAIASTQALKYMRYKVYARELAGNLGKILLTLLFFFLGLRLAGILIATILSSAFMAFLAVFFLNKLIPFFHKSNEFIYAAKQLIKFSIPQVLSNFLIFVILSSDLMILGIYRSSSEVGIYTMVIKIAMLISYILLSFNAIFSPIISDLHNRKKIENLDSLLKTVTRWNYTISLPIFLIIFLFAKPILAVLGNAYVLGASALMILSVSQFVSAATGQIGFIILMSGRTYIFLFTNIAAAVVNLLLNFLLVPTYGMVGAAIASAISLAGINILRVIIVAYSMRIQPYNRAYLKATVTAIICVAFVILAGNFIAFNKIITMIPAITFFMFAYCGLIIKMGFVEEDLVVIRTIKAKFFG